MCLLNSNYVLYLLFTKMKWLKVFLSYLKFNIEFVDVVYEIRSCDGYIHIVV